MSEQMLKFDSVVDVVHALSEARFDPILIGGMALVILGSPRVTKDFDFVIAHPRERLAELLDVFYAHGFELVSHVNSDDVVEETIDNRKVAGERIKIDEPASVYFFNHKTRMRIDLLFDFPIAAAELAAQATRTKIRSQPFSIASEDDLLRLKRIARKDRNRPGEADDIAFLEARLKKAH